MIAYPMRVFCEMLIVISQWLYFLHLSPIFDYNLMKSAQIDYSTYAAFMRGALSGSEICNKDNTLNHAYFNTKKGFYWSEKHAEQLIAGVLAYDLDVPAIRQHCFNSAKTEVELELRLCLLFGVKDIKSITEKELKELKKTHEKNGRKIRGE